MGLLSYSDHRTCKTEPPLKPVHTASPLTRCHRDWFRGFHPPKPRENAANLCDFFALETRIFSLHSHATLAAVLWPNAVSEWARKRHIIRCWCVRVRSAASRCSLPNALRPDNKLSTRSPFSEEKNAGNRTSPGWMVWISALCTCAHTHACRKNALRASGVVQATDVMVIQLIGRYKKSPAGLFL